MQTKKDRDLKFRRGTRGTDALMTYEQVGRSLGLTRQRVEQIERRTMRKFMERYIRMFGHPFATPGR